MNNKTELQTESSATEGLSSTEGASLSDLLCEDCGKNFTRTSDYLKQKRTDPLFKWSCAKCDECRDKRVDLAFKRLPEIMQAITT